jgi:hypothetical protein
LMRSVRETSCAAISLVPVRAYVRGQPAADTVVRRLFTTRTEREDAKQSRRVGRVLDQAFVVIIDLEKDRLTIDLELHDQVLDRKKQASLAAAVCSRLSHVRPNQRGRAQFSEHVHRRYKIRIVILDAL